MSDAKSPQWEACKVCGGDHWTKDHQYYVHHMSKVGPSESVCGVCGKPYEQCDARQPRTFLDRYVTHSDGCAGACDTGFDNPPCPGADRLTGPLDRITREGPEWVQVAAVDLLMWLREVDEA